MSHGFALGLRNKMVANLKVLNFNLVCAVRLGFVKIMVFFFVNPASNTTQKPIKSNLTKTIKMHLINGTMKTRKRNMM